MVAVTTTSSASYGDEPLPKASRILSEANLLGSNGESRSTRQVSQLNDQRVDARAKAIASEPTSWQALTAAIRDFPNLETKMAGVVLNGTVDDFDRRYVSDRIVTPTYSLNREAL